MKGFFYKICLEAYNAAYKFRQTRLKVRRLIHRE